MRPLLDILTDEKSLMEEIDVVSDAIEEPEVDGEANILKEHLDDLYVRLAKVRREIRTYFLRMPR